MTAQPNSHSVSSETVQKNGIDCCRAGDMRAARRRVRGWLLAGLLAVAAVLGLAPAAFAQDIIHVTPTGSDSANGSDWTTNATSLQHALSIATNGDEIWVASGVYTPGLTKTATFTVTSGIQLYGGFATTETVRTQRDWVANPTILSGDIGGDDITVGNVVTTATNITGTNAYHVLWLDGENGDPITTTTRIDGFTITAGNAGGGGEGGGLYCLGRGSGNACSPSIANVLFSGNSASDGGAMFCIGTNGGASSPSLVNVTFSGNSAGYDGGAMLSTGEYGGVSSPSLVNVTFSGNLAGYSGGAMYNNGYGDGGVSSPSLVN
ncbi:MAG: hypothetical protein KDE23_26960, partial [Caldilinea sp.]|nr:hypothetical protein [Caldilinea sp.]